MKFEIFLNSGTPLFIAASNGNIGIVKLLLNCEKINVNLYFILNTILFYFVIYTKF